MGHLMGWKKGKKNVLVRSKAQGVCSSIGVRLGYQGTILYEVRSVR